MKNTVQIFSAAFLAATVVGCAPYKNMRVLEAEERVVIYSEKPSSKDTNARKVKIMCPEPSPDALKTLAASMNIEKQEVATIAAAYSEAGANIGLRTHSIQLLRDQLFAICQAYANEGVSEAAYQMMLTRNQRNTVALMAIEQLTSVLRGASVALSGSAAVGPNQDLITNSKKLKAEAEAKYNPLSDADKAKPENKKLKEQIDAYDAAIDKAEKAIVAATNNATSTLDTGGRVDSATVAAVTQTVQHIADKVLDQNDLFYICLDTYQSSENNGWAMPQALKDRCDDVFLKLPATDVKGTGG